MPSVSPKLDTQLDTSTPAAPVDDVDRLQILLSFSSSAKGGLEPHGVTR